MLLLLNSSTEEPVTHCCALPVLREPLMLSSEDTVDRININPVRDNCLTDSSTHACTHNQIWFILYFSVLIHVTKIINYLQKIQILQSSVSKDEKVTSV